MEIAIVVVAWWNRGKVLERCLDRLTRARHLSIYPSEIHVVDCCSDDTTVSVIRSALVNGNLQAENVHVLPQQVGFSCAFNYAAKKIMMGSSSSTHIAVVDDDTWIDDYWFSRLGSAMSTSRNRRAGMWSGPIFTPGTTEINTAGHYVSENGACRDAGRKGGISDQFKPFCPCFAASVWSVEMLLGIGLLDAGQHVYYDDIDLGFRARLHDWQAEYVPGAIAYKPLHVVPDQFKSHCLDGRLVLMHRYAPDAVRTEFLSHLRGSEVEANERICRRNLRPAAPDSVRQAVWKLATNY